MLDPFFLKNLKTTAPGAPRLRPRPRSTPTSRVHPSELLHQLVNLFGESSSGTDLAGELPTHGRVSLNPPNHGPADQVRPVAQGTAAPGHRDGQPRVRLSDPKRARCRPGGRSEQRGNEPKSRVCVHLSLPLRLDRRPRVARVWRRRASPVHHNSRAVNAHCDGRGTSGRRGVAEDEEARIVGGAT